MSLKPQQNYKSLDRVRSAFGYSAAGLRHACSSEAAFQQELIVLVILSVLCLFLPVSLLLKVLLLNSHLLILATELINTAIEALADKVSRAQDPLIKQAKDMGSAAVLLMFGVSALLWSYAVWTCF